MYKIIQAQPSHIEQIIPYLSITCYWKEFVEGNRLNQSYEDFMSEWVVTPRLPFTKVLTQESNDQKIFGCVIAATTEELGQMPDYTPHLHPRVMEVFGKWFQFPVSDSVVFELFALEKELRKKGYGTKLYNIVETLAIEKGKNCISSFVWACFPDSLITFTRKGFITMDFIKFDSPIKSGLLYLEKKPDYGQIKDYFQSSEYINTKNLLLSN